MHFESRRRDRLAWQSPGQAETLPQGDQAVSRRLGGRRRMHVLLVLVGGSLPSGNPSSTVRAVSLCICWTEVQKFALQALKLGRNSQRSLIYRSQILIRQYRLSNAVADFGTTRF